MFQSLAKFITRKNLTAATVLKKDKPKKGRNLVEKISYFFALIFSVKNDYYHEKISMKKECEFCQKEVCIQQMKRHQKTPTCLKFQNEIQWIAF